MDTLPRLFLAARFLLFCFAALLLTGAADAQTLSVAPTSVSVQTNFGTNATSQTVLVKKTGAGALRWNVVQPTAPWVSVSPTSGTNNGTLILTFQTSGLAAQAQPYTTSFSVVSGNQSVTVSVAVTIVAVTPPTLTITCPANITVASPDGSPVAVNYTVTTSGGTPMVTLTVTPQSGSSFSVGTTTVQATSQDSSQPPQTANCSFTVTVTAPSSDWTFCAAENQFCAFSGTQQVRYGANNTYFIQTLTGGTQCSNAVFGDPIFGTPKHCDISAPPPPPTLTITCPANITVASPDGSAVVVTYTVTTSGGNPPVNLTVTPPSGSSFAVGTATVQANAQSQDGQTKSCSFAVTVTAPSSNWTFCAAENQFCTFSGTKQVRYGANNTFLVQTLTGGTQCSNAVFGDPIPGTVKHCDINSTAQVPGIGPQTAITCPAGAVDVLPGQSIQLIINANVGATTFCLHKGVYPITASIRPKTGNTFVGEYVLDSQGQPQPAILDGTGWTTTERTQAAFRVYDDPNDPNDPTDPVNDVTIRNLVVRNMPQWGIYAEWGINASQQLANHWTIDHNEIASSKWGLLFGPNFTVTNNYIHHNVGNSSSSIPDDRGGGYLGDSADNTTFDNNEIAYNGREQKVGRSSNVKFTNNFVHHNVGDGIWYDSNPNAAALIDNNRVEDNGRNGIFFEASVGATISNNAVRRHTSWDGIFISMSQNAQIFNNTLEGNYGGIDYFLNCFVLSATDDVKNNAAHDNSVVVGTQIDTYASAFTSTGCTSTQLALYLNGSKNLTFSRNTYRVPSLSFTRYFLWGGWKDWSQWQLVPQDGGGSISQ
jgi:hypothetical protein